MNCPKCQQPMVGKGQGRYVCYNDFCPEYVTRRVAMSVAAPPEARPERGHKLANPADPECSPCAKDCWCRVAQPAAGARETAGRLAQKFHEAYERLAPSFGYETRKASAKPWADVPEQNKKLMTAVCAEILGDAASQLESLRGMFQAKEAVCQKLESELGQRRRALADVRPLLLRLRAWIRFHRDGCNWSRPNYICDCGKEKLEKEIDQVTGEPK